jgi:hypothetical protein
MKELALSIVSLLTISTLTDLNTEPLLVIENQRVTEGIAVDIKQ